MNEVNEVAQTQTVQEKGQTAFPFAGEQLPDAAKTRTRAVSISEVDAERSYFRHLGRDIATSKLGLDVPCEIAALYFEYRRNITASQTSAKRMSDLIGFASAVIEYGQRTRGDGNGQGELILNVKAMRLPRPSEVYPGLDEEKSALEKAEAMRSGDADLSHEGREHLYRVYRGRLAQHRQMVVGFAYDLLMKSYEQGTAAPAAKKAYNAFLAAARVSRSVSVLNMLWTAFEQLYSTDDWFDNDRKGFNARSAFKNANRAAAHAKDRAEKEASKPVFKPVESSDASTAISDDPGYQSPWAKLSDEEKAARNVVAAENLKRLLTSLCRGSDVRGRCQVRDERVDEYFVVSFHDGYQTVDLVVDNHHSSTGLTRLDSWVREIASKDPQKVLVRDLKARLNYVATHPGAEITM